MSGLGSPILWGAEEPAQLFSGGEYAPVFSISVGSSPSLRPERLRAEWKNSQLLPAASDHRVPVLDLPR